MCYKRSLSTCFVVKTLNPGNRMLTTIIYRSHICEDVPVKALESMVAAANNKTGKPTSRGSCCLTAHIFSVA